MNSQISEVDLERASQQAIQFLLENRYFHDTWQSETRKILEKSQKSTEFVDLQSIIRELSSIIDFLTRNFENVDNFNFESIKSTNSTFGAAIFEIGLRIEKLKQEKDRILVADRLCSSIRRLLQVLKSFGKRVESSKNLEISEILSISSKLCRLFYEIHQLILKIFGGNSKFSKNFEKSIDEFNLRVVGRLERIQRNLDKNGQKNGKSKVMTSSIQEGIQICRQKTKTKTHAAGKIAESIICTRRGFLMENGLARARARVPRVRHQSKSENLAEIPKEGAEDVEILESARKMSKLVIDDVKKSIGAEFLVKF